MNTTKVNSKSNSTSTKVLKCVTKVPAFINAATKLSYQPDSRLLYWTRANKPKQEFDVVHIFEGGEDPSRPFAAAVPVQVFKGNVHDIFEKYKNYPYAFGDGINTYQDFCNLLISCSGDGQLADEYTVLVLTDIEVAQLKYNYKKNTILNQGYVYDEI